ncbi:MAG: GspE/PulE family protein, partial [Chlamydiota bacterium]|nr:GspE/PulE family protein [Chlamydiota bacterium]
MHELNAVDIGKILVQEKLISQTDLDRVFKGMMSGKAFDELVIGGGYVDERNFYMTLAKVLNLSFIDLSDYRVDQKIISVISQSLAKEHCVFPLFKIRENLTVAMADPSDVLALDRIRDESGCEPELVISTRSEINSIIDHYYGAGHSMGALVDNLRKREEKTEKRISSGIDMGDAEGERPVIQFVNLLIEHAVSVKASDIHIEPDIDQMRVRLRIDGVLHETTAPPKKYENAIVSRVKIMSELNIAESRIPQDGRFSMAVGGRQIDMRVSIVPTVCGENLIIRILDKQMLRYDMMDLGFSADAFQKIGAMLRKPYGMILVTGPTGSGKTTTLYSALRKINSPEKNLVTIEDPVEYRMELVRQIQVNPAVGLTFATGLRSIVRQDPDVIMVGEIRDAETARIAVQSALTGHLVLSTLHTNDAAGAPVRLVEMGIEPFLVTSSVIGVIAQRLVRKICEKCKKPDKLPDAMKQLYHLEDVPVKRGKGCRNCHQTGYIGRLGIYEILEIDTQIRELIVSRSPAGIIAQKAKETGMCFMIDDGLEKVKQGLTTLD